MSGFEVDVAGIITAWIVGSVLLVMAVGATLRFGVVPLIGAVADMRVRTYRPDATGGVERRLTEVESRLDRLEFATSAPYRSESDTAA